MMDDKQRAEVAWWREYYARLGHEGFIAQRQRDLERVLIHLPELAHETGRGLDMGCGCCSMFEGWGRDVDAYDPLLDEYNTILPADLAREVAYFNYVGNLPDGAYDWVACINVADHTPYPRALFDTIHRLLKPGGRLYFMVHYERDLTAPHWLLWDDDHTVSCLGGFEQHYGYFTPGDIPGRRIFWGRYAK